MSGSDTRPQLGEKSPRPRSMSLVLDDRVWNSSSNAGRIEEERGRRCQHHAGRAFQRNELYTCGRCESEGESIHWTRSDVPLFSHAHLLLASQSIQNMVINYYSDATRRHILDFLEAKESGIFTIMKLVERTRNDLGNME